MDQRQQNAPDLDRHGGAGKCHRQESVTYSLADQADHRDQVIKIIKQLGQALHQYYLADNRQKWTAALRIARLRVGLIESSII